MKELLFLLFLTEIFPDRIINVPSERKELKSYLYSILNYPNNYVEISDLPDSKIPSQLHKYAFNTILNLNLLFHPANEIITHLTMDIEVCQTFPDIRKQQSDVIPPHLLTGNTGNLKQSPEYSYR